MENENTSMDDQSPYEMKISMSVLEALGINLYSNAAAVISELVANAWDADANHVGIDWVKRDGEDLIEIRDDGCGMTREELSSKFLTVGYSKRISEGGKSLIYDRPFMGRKGIGKLSVFSIADVVEVHSYKNGVGNAFRIDIEDLKKKIQNDQTYLPMSIEYSPPTNSETSSGTVIKLLKLRRKRLDIVVNALRKRVARRFDVISLVPPATNDQENPTDAIRRHISELRREESNQEDLARIFYVTLDSVPITFDDRVELKKLEYLWEFGKETIPMSALSSTVHREVLPADITGNKSWKVSGWFGTSSKPEQLNEDLDAGSLKNIMVLARGRPIQEGILERLNLNRLFISYATGQVRADFLDDDHLDDIATSDRQRLMEDDPRVTALSDFLRASLLAASTKWSKWRPERKAQELVAGNAPIRNWIETLPEYQKGPALKLMGTIESLVIPESSDSKKDKMQLFQSGIIAFQRIGLREDSEKLDRLANMESADILNVLGTLDSYESAMYLDIIKARVEIITSFADSVDENNLEKILQEKLYSNLWLLDPSWDRVTQNVEMEERVQKMAESFNVKPSNDVKSKRIDLRYCNVQNRHVIIELKRPGVQTDIDELYDQGLTYVNALNACLEESGLSSQPSEVVFIVGKKPTAKKKPPNKTQDDYSRERVGALPGRLFRYQELIHQAKAQYGEYIEKNKTLDRVSKVLEELSKGQES